MKPYFFFDLETHLFGPGNMAPPPVVMSWGVGERCALVPKGEIEKTLAPVLEKAIGGEVVRVSMAGRCRCKAVKW